MIKKTILALAIVSACSVSVADESYWYTGIGIGGSNLDPEVLSLPHEEHSTQQLMGRVFAGRKFNEYISGDVSYNWLGSTDIESNSDEFNDGSVDYQSVGVDVNLHPFKGNFFINGGYAFLDTTFNDIDADNNQLNEHLSSAGLGYDFNISSNNEWNVRLEGKWQDTDVQFVSLSLKHNYVEQKYDIIDDNPVATPHPIVKEIKPATPEQKKEFSRVVLNGVGFYYDSATLTPEATFILHEQATKLTNEENENVYFSVLGHTCNLGSDEYNDNLSYERAKSVVNYMNSLGVSSERMIIMPMGEKHPIADNSTEEGRIINRRVEFVVH